MHRLGNPILAMFGKYSDDETFALVLGVAIGAVSWIQWYFQLAMFRPRLRPGIARWPFALVPLLCGAVLLYVLRRFSSEDVRTDPAYIVFYMIVGAAWVGVVRFQLPFFGLSPRDDVLERGNFSAQLAIIGALVGTTCCFAGGNVGNGPGWWVVLFSALLSTGSLLLLWWIIHWGSGLAEKVTLDRDPAAGWRAAGLFVGAGLMLGTAVAGDWASASATIVDFGSRSWPVLVLTATVIAIEHQAPPHPGRSPTQLAFAGWLPAITYIAGGLLVALKLLL